MEANKETGDGWYHISHPKWKRKTKPRSNEVRRLSQATLIQLDSSYCPHFPPITLRAISFPSTPWVVIVFPPLSNFDWTVPIHRCCLSFNIATPIGFQLCNSSILLHFYRSPCYRARSFRSLHPTLSFFFLPLCFNTYKCIKKKSCYSTLVFHSQVIFLLVRFCSFSPFPFLAPARVQSSPPLEPLINKLMVN